MSDHTVESEEWMCAYMAAAAGALAACSDASDAAKDCADFADATVALLNARMRARKAAHEALVASVLAQKTFLYQEGGKHVVLTVDRVVDSTVYFTDGYKADLAEVKDLEPVSPTHGV